MSTILETLEHTGVVSGQISPTDGNNVIFSSGFKKSNDSGLAKDNMILQRQMQEIKGARWTKTNNNTEITSMGSSTCKRCICSHRPAITESAVALDKDPFGHPLCASCQPCSTAAI